MSDSQPETRREQIAELLQEFYVNEHRDIYDTVDAVLDLIKEQSWSVSQKEAIREQIQNYHHMIRHSVEAYKLEQRVATHYEDECIRKIEAITKGEEQ